MRTKTFGMEVETQAPKEATRLRDTFWSSCVLELYDDEGEALQELIVSAAAVTRAIGFVRILFNPAFCHKPEPFHVRFFVVRAIDGDPVAEGPLRLELHAGDAVALTLTLRLQ